jgi:hypothetical protein
VMAFASARTLMRFSILEAGSAVRESGMGNLDDLLNLLGCQLGAPLHRKLGRTVLAGQTHDRPDGYFQHGTRVVKRRQRGGYFQVESETGVTAWISPDPLELIFRLTHEVTEDTPYYLKANGSPPGRPPDGILPAKTGLLVYGVDDAATGGSDRWAHVQWSKDGDIAFVDIEKYRLKRL